jgi:putative oxidoreductase
MKERFEDAEIRVPQVCPLDALFRMRHQRLKGFHEDEPDMNAAGVLHLIGFLLGLIFLVFGLNGFLHFIPMPPPSGIAGQFMGALFVSNYLVVVFLLQIIAAVLLLIDRYVPLALTLLAPIIVNILLFHILMAPSGLALAIVVAVLWIATFFSVRSAFGWLLQPRVLAQELR